MNDLLLAVGLFVFAGGGTYAKQLLDANEALLPTDARIALGYVDVEDPWDAEDIGIAYARDELTLAEMERRLDVVLDERADAMRETLEAVSGIGHLRAINIAAAFESERALAHASKEELMDVPDIGPEYADAVLARVRDDFADAGKPPTWTERELETMLAPREKPVGAHVASEGLRG